MIQFKKMYDTALIPQRQTEGAAGFDLHCHNPSKRTMSVSFGESIAVPTGIAAAIPHGWAGFVKPRSGWAVKFSIDTMAGVIDSDFRGEINVILTKESPGVYMINDGDRIAQLVVMPVMLDSVEVETLGDTDRGTGGFGSTGAK